MASGGADRIEQDLTWADVAAPMIDPDEDSGVEDALLAYAHRKAARTGAEWFAAEWQRRDEAEGEGVARPFEPAAASTFATTLRPIPQHDEGVVDAEVEANVVNEGPAGLGLRPEQPKPAVVAPPVAEPAPEPEPAPPSVVAPRAVLAPVVATPVPAPVTPAPVIAATASPVVEAAQPANPETAPPALRHPTVPRPPVVEEPEPTSRKERRRNKRKRALEEPVAAMPPMFTAGEWARMSPGARRLYGMDNAPPS